MYKIGTKVIARNPLSTIPSDNEGYIVGREIIYHVKFKNGLVFKINSDKIKVAEE